MDERLAQATTAQSNLLVFSTHTRLLKCWIRAGFRPRSALPRARLPDIQDAGVGSSQTPRGVEPADCPKRRWYQAATSL